MTAKKLTVAERDAAVVDSAFRLVCLILDRSGLAMLEQAAELAAITTMRPSGTRMSDEAVATVRRLAHIAGLYRAAL